MELVSMSAVVAQCVSMAPVALGIVAMIAVLLASVHVR